MSHDEIPNDIPRKIPGAISEYPLPSQVLIVGCGDIGLRLARRLRVDGREVTGVVRSAPSAERLRAEGITGLALDLDAGEVPPVASLVFYFAAPPGEGRQDPRLRGYLARLTRAPQRLVYISTSGVYGDCGGRWIDEQAPLQPQSERAWRRLDAERALAECAARQSGFEAVILRVPGIYGPGRLPEARLRQGLPVLRADESPYSNRIHAEDLAEAALRAARFGGAGRAYNLSDGHPTSMSDYFQRCARLLGLPEPPEVSMAEARRALTPGMLSFLEESKRLITRRAREELGFVPRYPTLDDGLPSCLSSA